MTNMCTKTKAKVILITFNFLFWAAGTVMLGFGIWMKVDPAGIISSLALLNDVDHSDPLVFHAAVLFIAVGAFAFVVGFLGLCGAYNEKQTMLLTYSIFLIFFIATEIAAIVIIVVFRNKVDTVLQEKKLKEIFIDNRLKAAESAMNHIEAELKCCGVVDFADYVNNFTYFNSMKKKLEANRTTSSSSANDDIPFVPDSCCAKLGNFFLNHKHCQLDAKLRDKNSRFINIQGCLSAVKSWLNRNTLAMVIIVAGILAFQLVGCTTSCSLCLQLRRIEKNET